MSSEFQRAYSVLKGYINREWDRIKAVEELQARDELETSLGTTSPSRPTVDSVRRDLDIVFDASHARKILAVDDKATFDQIQEAYNRLTERSSPEKFPAGSEEQSQAVRIQRKIHRAYKLLSEEFSLTERRFKSLEIE
jgi:hypothetical protein